MQKCECCFLMHAGWLAVWLGLLAPSSGGSRRFLNYTGDIMLGALFPIHHKGSGGAECGKIQLEDGVQPLEAMLYTLELINRNPDLLPGIKLGMIAYDSCDSPAYALEQTLDIIKGFIAHYSEFHEPEFQCKDGSTPKFRGGGFDKVVAVIGAQSSSVTIQVATMLRLFRVPQVSYMATSPSLSDQNRFPYFFRTVPSDVNQAHAMLEILRQFNWTYVSVVHSDNEYGNHGFEILSSLAGRYNVCFTAAQHIDKENFSDRDYDGVLNNIVNKTEVRVVVVFADKFMTQKLMDAAGRHGITRRFVWILCDAWNAAPTHRGIDIAFRRPMTGDGKMQQPPADTSEAQNDERVLEGALAVQPLSRNLAGFDTYFKSLSPSHGTINPWFEECLREYCRRQHSGAHYRLPSLQIQGDMTSPPEEITTWTDITSDSTTGATTLETPETCEQHGGRRYRQQKYLHFVRDAVYAVAQALHNLQASLCGPGFTGVCEDMRHIDSDLLRTYLANVTFNDEGGRPFKFINGRDGPPRYSILNFQRDSNGHRYHWKAVGNYTLDDNGLPILNIDHDAISYRKGEAFPTSTCATPCAMHQVKIQQREDTCCWRCRSCGKYQVKVDEYHCEDCAMGSLPSHDHSRCVAIPEEFIDYQNPWAIAAMAVASLGILATVFVLVIFWTYSDTPIVKASGRELSYLLLVGTLASFCVTFVIVARPTPFTCGLTRFFLGFCYTLCYAAIVTKTNRIARIFSNRPISPHKTRYTSPTSQLVITALLTSVEIVINVSWLMYEPPSVTHSFPTRESRLLICEGLENYSYMVGLLYPFILIGLCTAYAVKTRKCPGGFNETRHIAFTNYTAIIIWLAFVPLYLASTSNSIRVVTLAISLSLSGLVQLGCLFSPKVYIVLFKPEKNTKEVVMSQHRSSSYLATPTTANQTPVPVVVSGGMHHVQDASDVTVSAGSVVAELNRKAQQHKLRPQYSPQVARTWRGRPLPTPMGQNSPVHNQSSTSSIREEDSIDISEQASTKSSPA
ncbi:metabotropic glutamate receptor 3 isoform X2 [Cryptotermes secundus]|uniref:metabotropic glutamate receptor 3 isoform X2 n=1 Tax=Cryptotermes secundus TaxID=105785 RepID=UPI000CD7CD56|nr:metabotropic glutamate receptor 3 isoform X2 [Cryptotermes secundus]